ncbi:MAG: Uma2 family endonuclease [Candidatus Nealsonbacteria bacterium]|nr:Uma2 family endonuclease [Candidatus Nealsonbacteria bacterium]
MAITPVLEEQIEVPMDIRCLDDFRRWAVSDAFPERGRIDYIAGRIDVDMSPEDLHTHGKLKTEFVGVLWQQIKREGLGEIYTDSTRVSCPEADVSAEPDVVFISEASLDSGRVRLVPKASGAADRYVELEGPPDLIVEIVSDSSARKDTERLPVAYYRAGVTEFWLIDARGDELLFHIHRRGPSQYEPVEPDADGYQHSAVLGSRYRLDRSRNAKGRIEFDLQCSRLAPRDEA